jgi:hypothetical protein
MKRPAIITFACRGPNAACRKAAREGRTVHIIPGDDDDVPYRLILPTYHFTSAEEASDAEKQAWLCAPVVEVDIDLYDFRKRKIAHKIRKGFIDPSRR